MALSGGAEAIGFISSVFTIFSFIQSIDEKPNAGATVQIKAGLPALDSEGDSLDGKISHIYGFDTRNGYSGSVDGCHLDSGGLCSKTIDQDVPGRIPGYIGVSNENDATCIAWIIANPYENQVSPGVWTGDIGANCGHNWYASSAYAGKHDGKKVYPKCTWLDADHTNDIKDAALKFDVQAYGDSINDTISDPCAATVYGSDNGPISEAPGKRNALKPRTAGMKNHLIWSNIEDQSAQEMCDDDLSWGPDFVGSDGHFCDMENKVATPLCSTKNVDGCIDIDEQNKNVNKRMDVARREASVTHKSYKQISKWEDADD